MDPIYYTVKQAADILEVSKMTIFRHIDALNLGDADRFIRTAGGKDRVFLTEKGLMEVQASILAASGRPLPGDLKNYLETARAETSKAAHTGTDSEQSGTETERDEAKTPQAETESAQSEPIPPQSGTAAEVADLREQLREKREEIAWLRAQVEKASAIADQAQKLQAAAERRLIAAGIDADPDAAEPVQADDGDDQKGRGAAATVESSTQSGTASEAAADAAEKEELRQTVEDLQKGRDADRETITKQADEIAELREALSPLARWRLQRKRKQKGDRP